MAITQFKTGDKVIFTHWNDGTTQIIGIVRKNSEGITVKCTAWVGPSPFINRESPVGTTFGPSKKDNIRLYYTQPDKNSDEVNIYDVL